MYKCDVCDCPCEFKEVDGKIIPMPGCDCELLTEEDADEGYDYFASDLAYDAARERAFFPRWRD